MRYALALSAVMLGGCGSEAETETASAYTDEPAEIAATCESITSDVVSVSEDHTPSLIKIYEPEKISETTDELMCKGQAVSSLGSQRLPVYYRRFVDEDGDVFVEYNGEPMASRSEPKS